MDRTNQSSSNLDRPSHAAPPDAADPSHGAYRCHGRASRPSRVRNEGPTPLVYRTVGRRFERYPEWLHALRGQSGVYVIREAGEVVYVGESHTGRLFETLTRHFQVWRRWKDFWDGQFGEGHDPGLTYPREAVEVAVRITAHGDPALEEEARLIQRLAPRDNLIGQPEAEPEPAPDDDEVPF